MSDVIRLVLVVGIVHAAVLALLLFLVKRIILHDAKKAVDSVRAVETEVRKREEGIIRRIEDHEKEFARKKGESEEQLQRQRQESERESRQLKDRMIAEAKAESDQIVNRAKQNEEKMRQQLEQEMEEKAVEYAGDIFRLVFSEKMNNEINRQMITELLDALDEVDATSITVDPSQVEFHASHALPQDQKDRLEELLKRKFGADIKVRETVQEELMGGLIFKLGSLEVDGSLRTRCQEAVAEVKKMSSL